MCEWGGCLGARPRRRDPGTAHLPSALAVPAAAGSAPDGPCMAVVSSSGSAPRHILALGPSAGGARCPNSA